MALFRKGFIALAKIPQTARRDNIDRPPDGFAKLYIEDNQEQRTAVMVPPVRAALRQPQQGSSWNVRTS
jgi:hypothetical protein